MQEIYAWGLEVIRAFQSVQSPALTFIVKCITFLGNPAAYMLILPIIFWCFDEKKGFLITFVCLISGAFNTIIKGFLKVPRPFVTDPALGLISETGFSTPSGHAQGSAALWITLALLIPSDGTKKRTAFKICLAVMPPLLIGLSRVYLGVHYPTDVLLGWFLGAFVAVAAFFLFPLAEKYLSPLTRSFKILILAVAVFAMNALHKADTSLPAALFGFTAGWILLCDTGGFNATSKRPLQKIIRALAGFAGLAVIYVGLKKLSPTEGEAQYALFRFIRYAAVGFWMGFAVPKLSRVLKLADGSQSTDS